MARLCTVCGVVCEDGRCARHPRTSGIGVNHAIHSDLRWIALSKREIARHVGQHGWICPGDGPEHPAHPVTPGLLGSDGFYHHHDLTLDHELALEDGGAPFDRANTRVLCRSWNSTLGARLVNARRAGRVMRRSPLVLDERAQIRARFLG